jgi:hypothetical protein
LFTNLFAALTLSVSVDAQLFTNEGSRKDSTTPKVDFGIKVGTNTQRMSGNFWDDGYSTGISGGFFARMHKNKIGGVVEILVSTFDLTSTAAFDSAHPKEKFNSVYLNVPVLFEYSFIPQLAIQAGPEYSNLVSVNSKNVPYDVKNFFKQGEFSLVIGFEARLHKNFLLGARYRYGLTNVNNETLVNGTWNTQAMLAYIGYTIPTRN